MAKNVVVCCDGTANEFAKDRTNVVKLFRTLVHDSYEQATYYHPGLGTMEAVGAISSFGRKVTKLLGKAIGYGLESDIRDAYVFLMRYFEPGDRVFMFGFSRGAYTVRALGSLLHMYGLIRKGNEPLVPYAIRMLVAANKYDGDRVTSGRAATQVQPAFELAANFKEHFCDVSCKPHFVGVWDTVSSVGWIENPTRLPYTASNPDIEIGRHAVAIDERRAFFRTNLWHSTAESGPQDLKQVWFPGVHCDVGGGYPEAESGLSKIALEWMIREAASAGLMVDEIAVDLVLGASGNGYVQPDARALMHDSLTPRWWPAEFVPKRHYNWAKHKEEHRMNLFRSRTIPPRALVHESAFQRGDAYANRLPADAIRVS